MHVAWSGTEILVFEQSSDVALRASTVVSLIAGMKQTTAIKINTAIIIPKKIVWPLRFIIIVPSFVAIGWPYAVL
jgi:hypothetical protein